MALIADFMLVWLPAPTVSLRPRLTAGAGGLAKFFYNCPDNAFQVNFPSSLVQFPPDDEILHNLFHYMSVFATRVSPVCT